MPRGCVTAVVGDTNGQELRIWYTANIANGGGLRSGPVLKAFMPFRPSCLGCSNLDRVSSDYTVHLDDL